MEQKIPPSEEPYVTFWVQTHLGVYYCMPDMLPDHVDRARRQLDQPLDYITVTNISGVVMMIPKRIIKTAGTNDRLFWEASNEDRTAKPENGQSTMSCVWSREVDSR